MGKLKPEKEKDIFFVEWNQVDKDDYDVVREFRVEKLEDYNYEEVD